MQNSSHPDLMQNSVEPVHITATHSEFAPYMTTIGLYNDNKELLAVSKLSRAIKKDPDLGYTFIVKFDI